jgi:hypothetical protein
MARENGILASGCATKPIVSSMALAEVCYRPQFLGHWIRAYWAMRRPDAGRRCRRGPFGKVRNPPKPAIAVSTCINRRNHPCAPAQTDPLSGSWAIGWGVGTPGRCAGTRQRGFASWAPIPRDKCPGAGSGGASGVCSFGWGEGGALRGRRGLPGTHRRSRVCSRRPTPAPQRPALTPTNERVPRAAALGGDPRGGAPWWGPGAEPLAFRHPIALPARNAQLTRIRIMRAGC